MAQPSPFSSVLTVIGAISKTVDGLPHAMVLLEDARKVSRLARRVEVLIMDLQPYVQPYPAAPVPAAFLSVLQEIEKQLNIMHNAVSAMAVKGPLASLMQGDRMLATLQSAATALATALDSIKGRLPEETVEQLASVKAQLQRCKFELSSEQSAIVTQFRAGVRSLQAAQADIVKACSGILTAMTGGLSQLSTEAFQSALAELNNELMLVTSNGDPAGDAVNLKVMMDVLRMQQRRPGPPLPFICPLTHQVMYDPVILRETGHSYERVAIEQWYQRGQRICPRTGAALGGFKLHLIPNQALREAIQEWRMFGSSGTWEKPEDTAQQAASASATPTPTQAPSFAYDIPADNGTPFQPPQATSAAPSQPSTPSAPGAGDIFRLPHPPVAPTTTTQQPGSPVTTEQATPLAPATPASATAPSADSNVASADTDGAQS